MYHWLNAPISLGSYKINEMRWINSAFNKSLTINGVDRAKSERSGANFPTIIDPYTVLRVWKISWKIELFVIERDMYVNEFVKFRNYLITLGYRKRTYRW